MSLEMRVVDVKDDGEPCEKPLPDIRLTSPRRPAPPHQLPTFVGPSTHELRQPRGDSMYSNSGSVSSSHGNRSTASADSLGRSSSMGSMISVGAGSVAGQRVLYQRKEGKAEYVPAHLYGVISDNTGTNDRGGVSVILALDGQRKLLAVRDIELLSSSTIRSRNVAACKDMLRFVAQLPHHPSVVEYYSVDVHKRRAVRSVTASANPAITPASNGSSTISPQSSAVITDASCSTSAGSAAAAAPAVGVPQSSGRSIASSLRRRHKSLVAFMEYVPGCTVRSIIETFAESGPVQQLRAPTLSLVRHVVREAASGLQHLHANGMVHMNLSTEKLLYTVDGRVKVFGVFGTSIAHDIATGTAAASHRERFVAPELLTQLHSLSTIKNIEASADIWSLGCVAFELLSSHAPFPHLETLSSMLLAFSMPMLDLRKCCGDIHDSLPSDALDFLRLCWQLDPTKRPDVGALLLHPFLAPLTTHSSASSMSATSQRGLDPPSRDNSVCGFGDDVVVVDEDVGPSASQISGPTNTMGPIQPFVPPRLQQPRAHALSLSPTTLPLPLSHRGFTSPQRGRVLARRASVTEETIQRFVFLRVIQHVAASAPPSHRGPGTPPPPPPPPQEEEQQHQQHGGEWEENDRSTDARAVAPPVPVPGLKPYWEDEACRHAQLQAWADLQDLPLGERDDAVCERLRGQCDAVDALSVGSTGGSGVTLSSVGTVKLPPDVRLSVAPRTKSGATPSTSLREFCFTFVCCCLDDPSATKELRRRRRRRVRMIYRFIGIPCIVILSATVTTLLVLFLI